MYLLGVRNDITTVFNSQQLAWYKASSEHKCQTKILYYIRQVYLSIGYSNDKNKKNAIVIILYILFICNGILMLFVELHVMQGHIYSY